MLIVGGKLAYSFKEISDYLYHVFSSKCLFSACLEFDTFSNNMKKNYCDLIEHNKCMISFRVQSGNKNFMCIASMSLHNLTFFLDAGARFGELKLF